jgi:hypothetical protein
MMKQIVIIAVPPTALFRQLTRAELQRRQFLWQVNASIQGRATRAVAWITSRSQYA